MKKKVSYVSQIILLLFVMIFSFACSGEKSNIEEKEETQETEKKANIMVSFYPLHGILNNVAKDIPEFELTSLTSMKAGCLHDYQLSVDEVKKLNDANVLIVNGLGMEALLQKAIDNASVDIIDSSTNIPDLIEAKNDDHGEKYNAHIWMDIDNYIAQTEYISLELAKRYPDFENKLTENKNDYINSLNGLKEESHKDLESFKGQKAIALNEDFTYFASQFDIEITNYIQEHEEVQPSASAVSEIIENIKKYNINVILTDNNANNPIVDTICNETGAQKVNVDLMLYQDNEKVDLNDYIEKMNKNIKNLKEALEHNE